MANQFGAKYTNAYIDSPPANIGTDASAVKRVFVDTYATGTGTADGIQVGETLTVGVKLRPGARIIGTTSYGWERRRFGLYGCCPGDRQFRNHSSFGHSEYASWNGTQRLDAACDWKCRWLCLR